MLFDGRHNTIRRLRVTTSIHAAPQELPQIAHSQPEQVVEADLIGINCRVAFRYFG